VAQPPWLPVSRAGRGWGLQALQWQAKHTPADVIMHREAMMAQLETAGLRMRQAGVCAGWFQGVRARRCGRCDDRAHTCGRCGQAVTTRPG